MDDKRKMIKLVGILTLKLKHDTLKINTGTGQGTKFTIMAYRNCMGSICMLMPTQYHNNHRDTIPRNHVDLELYNQDRMGLHKKHATLKINTGTGQGTKLTVEAYRNGMGSICMLTSTQYHNNHWDIIPRHPADIELYYQDRMGLHKKYLSCQQVFMTKTIILMKENSQMIFTTTFSTYCR